MPEILLIELTELWKIGLQTIVFNDFLPTLPPFLCSVFGH